MERIPTLFHYLFSGFHLGLEILLVGCQGQAFGGFNQVKHITLYLNQFSKLRKAKQEMRFD
jgi:hypothetical protein